MWSNDALVIKLRKAQARLLTWKIALVSASVESAAIDDWMFVVHDTIVPLRSPTLACIDLRSGRILANAASM